MIDCFKIKSVKQGEILARKDDLCKNGIFFIVEGDFTITESTKKPGLFGEGCFINLNDTYKVEVRMR